MVPAVRMSWYDTQQEIHEQVNAELLAFFEQQVPCVTCSAVLHSLSFTFIWCWAQGSVESLLPGLVF